MTTSAIGRQRKIVHLVSTGDFEEALSVYKHLVFHYHYQPHEEDLSSSTTSEASDEDPRASTFLLPSILKACACATVSSFRHLQLITQIHASTFKISTCVSHLPTANALLFAYAKRSGIRSARSLFDEMRHRDMITWSCMVITYNNNGFQKVALDMFRRMHADGFQPRPELVAMVISSCGRMGNMDAGRQMHAMSICAGESIRRSVHVSTSLIDMYSRCLDYSTALSVFQFMAERNVVSWTAIINGSSINGDHHSSLQLFSEMLINGGISPNRATLLSVLAACSELGAIEEGKQIHGYAFRHSLDFDTMLSSAFIDMYGNSSGRAIKLAHHVFDGTTNEQRDVTMWTAMITCCSKNGDYVGALKLFQRMRAQDIPRPNSVTILALVDACTTLSSHNLGLAIYAIAVTSGVISDVSLANSFINMYSRMGYLEYSVNAFAEMPIRDSLSWTTMISAYGLHGRGYEALTLYDKMLTLESETIKPDQITFLSILNACNHSGLVDVGKRIFDHMTGNHHVHLFMQHYACYVDLLGRSGRIEEAWRVVNNMPMTPSAKMLTSLASACKSHGMFDAALSLGHQLIADEPPNGDGANYTLLSMAHAERGDWGV